uniref:Uncharacterized protein n=1 Tax=viral metagenome TaxID=1070528 RepID=A0A6C0B7I9_9ZZZZ
MSVGFEYLPLLASGGIWDIFTGAFGTNLPKFFNLSFGVCLLPLPPVNSFNIFPI